MIRLVFIFALMLAVLPAQAADRSDEPREPGFFYRLLRGFAPETAVTVWRSSRPPLNELLAKRGFELGQPLYLRIFKEDAIIEAWLKKGDRFELFEMYPICTNSGGLGPKLREGDRQSPEGFYEIDAKHLHPNSQYHLAINMGYPNAYDKAMGRTGGFLMIHGACASIGCYALTNENIEEVYALAAAALEHGQESVPVHAFPFRMSENALVRHRNNQWAEFWVNDLLPVYEFFEVSRVPPRIMTCDKSYQVMEGLDPAALPGHCTPIASWGRQQGVRTAR